MGLAFAPVLLVVIVLYVAWPLLKGDPEQLEAEEHATELEATLEEKDVVVSSLKDIDMDFRTGKLSEADYANLRQEFEQRAVNVFRRLEGLGRKSSAGRARKQAQKGK